MDYEAMNYSSASAYLADIFEMINNDWFNGELEIPVITIQSSPKSYGHVVLGDMWHIESEGYMELNISAGTLDRSIYNVVATIVHEAVHIYCYANKIKDTSNGNVYHNKNFKILGESHGLLIEKHEKYGYTITTPSPALIEWINNQGLVDIKMARNESTVYNGGSGKGTDTNVGDDNGDEGSKTPRKKSHIRKYVCQGCGCSVRASKELNIGCLDCGVKMIIVN